MSTTSIEPISTNNHSLTSIESKGTNIYNTIPDIQPKVSGKESHTEHHAFFTKLGIKLKDGNKLENGTSHQELFNLSEGVSLNTWKMVANISAKLLQFDDEIVLVECLIDKSNAIYEEREFTRTIFEGYDLQIGNLFKVCIYRRANQEMIEIKNNPKLVSPTDFPEFDFFNTFSDLKLNKKLG